MFATCESVTEQFNVCYICERQTLVFFGENFWGVTAIEIVNICIDYSLPCYFMKLKNPKTAIK